MGKQQVFVGGEQRTIQSAKDECDINIIVERAKRGADLSQLTRDVTPMFGDFTGLPSYRECLIAINAARDAFMALDASVRKRFSNDPAALLDFLADAKNRDEAVRLGLVKPPEAPAAEDPVLGELKGLRKDISDAKSKKRSDGEVA